jgi:hypothetical protein
VAPDLEWLVITGLLSGHEDTAAFSESGQRVYRLIIAPTSQILERTWFE